MNRLINIFVSLFLGIAMFTSCSPEEFSLGGVDVQPGDLVEGIAFKIEHDASNPNIVYLKSLVDSKYTPLWTHPQGRSQDRMVTLKIPFAGTYEVTFGVETRGGIVYGSPVTFTVDQMYAEFISDPMWILLAGGSGEEKTWYLDLDAEATCRYFVGPMYFYGVDDCWETVTEGLTLPEGADSWSWQADYPSNSWMMGAADFGTMTFDLKAGAHVTVEHLTIPSRGTERGTYQIDVDKHTMRMNDASPLHDSGRDGVVIDWGDIKILSLTENTMQLGVIRDAVLSGEGACLLVYNYISKDYKDNWTPGEQQDPEPELPAGWKDAISQTVITSVKWVLSDQNPLDWCNLDGSRMNGWDAPGDYPDWLGTPDYSVYGGFSMTMNSADNTVEFVTPDGNTTSCTYGLDEKGIYSFSAPVPSFALIGWASFAADGNNQLRIMSIEKNAAGKVTGMWLGAKDAAKPEYLAYHLIATAGSGGGEDEVKYTELPVDNSKLIWGDFEEKGNLRIELYNEWGSSQPDPCINRDNLVFSSRLEVTFTLSGITFKEGAAGTYNAGLEFADGGWEVQYWADGNAPKANDAKVKGNGKYTVYFDTNGATSSGANVFCIDVMNNFWNEIEDTSAIGVTINSIKLY